MRYGLLAIIFPLCLAACGGGGSDSPPPPAELSYPSPNVFVVGTTVTPLTPTVTSSVSNYAINPSLPAGLALSADTGAISGTPTAVTATAIYTVTASSTGGSATFPVSITVNDVLPSIAYPTTIPAFTKGVPVEGLTPSNSGGAVVSWSVSPALPAGLAFSTVDGSITGTPTNEAAAATYVVTAENSGGRSSVNLRIGVASVLLELGHCCQIKTIKYSDSRVLTQDLKGYWVLWDHATTSIIASGGPQFASDVNPCDEEHPAEIDMAGPTVVIAMCPRLEVRASADGRSLFKISTNMDWWKLAADGSYIVAGSAAGLSAWSPSGTLLISRPGDYSKAKSYAAAGEIRVALGAAGQNVIETISVPTGTSSVAPPFQGQFHSWFLDGEQFLSNLSTTVWTYSKTGVQQDLTSLPTIENLTGQGRWFWTHAYQSTPGYTLNIYAVGASAAPTLSYDTESFVVPIPSRTSIGVLRYGTGLVTDIDLSGATPVATDHVVPIAFLSAFVSVSNSQWLVGNEHGVVLDSAGSATPLRYFGFGAAWSIAGSSTRAAVATASGRIFYFDARTGALEGTINAFASELALSSDGSILAAGVDHSIDSKYHNDLSIAIVSLPTGSEIHRWPYTFDRQPYPFDMSLSGSGTALGQILGTWRNSSWQFTRQVTSPNGGPLIWSDSITLTADDLDSIPPIHLSPDGTLIAASNDVDSLITNISKNGILVAAIPGWALGWLDNSRLLMRGGDIYDWLGSKLGSIQLEEVNTFDIVTADSIYEPTSNSIFSLITGEVTWRGTHPSDGIGAVAGSRVLYLSGQRVLLEPY